MARGYPDDFGNNVFPSFGNYISDTDTINQAASGSDSIVDLVAPGILSDFQVICSGMDDFSAHYINIEIDGNSIMNWRFDGLFDVLSAPHAPHRLSCYNYDIIQKSVGILLSREINFHTSCKITLSSSITEGMVIQYWFGYYAVE